jgi:hypothetical protein
MKLSTAYLIVGTIVIALVRRAHAAELPTVAATGGINWGYIGGALVLLGLAIGGAIIWLRKRNPAAAAKVGAAVGAGTAAAGHDLAEVLRDLSAVIKARIPPAGAVESPAASAMEAPATQIPPGKLGQPGPLTVQCTGDPKVDHAAFDAAYF